VPGCADRAVKDGRGTSGGLAPATPVEGGRSAPGYRSAERV
jgi:hypothetical protein